MKTQKTVRIPLAEILILGSVVISILFSVYLFTYTENKSLAFFIGLWPPTLMGVVNYINIKFKL
jgi:Na+-translocating ferredoxin:NAD+ oxidoreductase RnfE subunit